MSSGNLSLSLVTMSSLLLNESEWEKKYLPVIAFDHNDNDDNDHNDDDDDTFDTADNDDNEDNNNGEDIQSNISGIESLTKLSASYLLSSLYEILLEEEGWECLNPSLLNTCVPHPISHSFPQTLWTVPTSIKEKYVEKYISLFQNILRTQKVKVHKNKNERTTNHDEEEQGEEQVKQEREHLERQETEQEQLEKQQKEQEQEENQEQEQQLIQQQFKDEQLKQEQELEKQAQTLQLKQEKHKQQQQQRLKQELKNEEEQQEEKVMKKDDPFPSPFDSSPLFSLSSFHSSFLHSSSSSSTTPSVLSTSCTSSTPSTSSISSMSPSLQSYLSHSLNSHFPIIIISPRWARNPDRLEWYYQINFNSMSEKSKNRVGSNVWNEMKENKGQSIGSYQSTLQSYTKEIKNAKEEEARGEEGKSMGNRQPEMLMIMEMERDIVKEMEREEIKMILSPFMQATTNFVSIAELHSIRYIQFGLNITHNKTDHYSGDWTEKYKKDSKKRMEKDNNKKDSKNQKKSSLLVSRHRHCQPLAYWRFRLEVKEQVKREWKHTGNQLRSRFLYEVFPKLYPSYGTVLPTFSNFDEDLVYYLLSNYCSLHDLGALASTNTTFMTYINHDNGERLWKNIAKREDFQRKLDLIGKKIAIVLDSSWITTEKNRIFSPYFRKIESEIKDFKDNKCINVKDFVKKLLSSKLVQALGEGGGTSVWYPNFSEALLD